MVTSNKGFCLIGLITEVGHKKASATSPLKTNSVADSKDNPQTGIEFICTGPNTKTITKITTPDFENRLRVNGQVE